MEFDLLLGLFVYQTDKKTLADNQGYFFVLISVKMFEKWSKAAFLKIKTTNLVAMFFATLSKPKVTFLKMFWKSWHFERLTSWGLGCRWLQWEWWWWITSCDVTVCKSDAKNRITDIMTRLPGCSAGCVTPLDILQQLNFLRIRREAAAGREAAAAAALLSSSWMQPLVAKSDCCYALAWKTSTPEN